MHDSLKAEQWTRSAFWVALIPPIVAGAILGSFYLTRSDFLPPIGLLFLYACLIPNLISLILMAIFILTWWRRNLSRKRLLQAIAVLIGLVVNYPIAWGCVLAGTWISGLNDLTVINESGDRLEKVELRIHYGNRIERKALGTIDENQRAHLSFHADSDAHVLLAWQGKDGKPLECEAIGYVTNDMGVQSTLMIEKKSDCRRIEK